MDYVEFIQNRIAELRIKKGVSARDMSLSLGQSESYINKIENKRTLPSMTGFVYICEYFGITPVEFFQSEVENPSAVSGVCSEIAKLSESDLALVSEVVLRLNSR